MTAIESKQVAQQDAERSKFIVMIAEQEAKAAIIKAEVRGVGRVRSCSTASQPPAAAPSDSHPTPVPSTPRTTG